MTSAGELSSDIIRPPTEKVEEGETSKTRMRSSQKCREMVQLFIKDDEKRSSRRAAAKGCLDGNPTTNRVLPGYAWTCRLNFGELEGIMDSARVPYYSLFSGVPTYAVFDTSFQRNHPDHARWNNIIAEKWTRMVNRWKQFRWHMQASEFEMLFEGWGPLVFDDPVDWRFTSVPARCVKVPKEAYSVIDERMPVIVILRDYRVHELWQKISDESVATKRGWNVQQVKWSIQNACNRPTTANHDWEYWQQQLRNGDLAVGYGEADVVRCAKVLLKENGSDGKSGKISEFLITYDDVGKPEGRTEDYLFSKPNQYESYDDVLNVSFQNTGDGTWHSVRGVGIKSFRHVEIMDRTLGKAVDNAFLAAMPIIQPGSNQAQDQRALMVMGPVATLAPGAELMQNRLAADASAVLAVNRVIANKLYQNIGHFNGQDLSRDDGRGETITATEAELKEGRSTSLRQAQMDNRYQDLDLLYEQMFNRAIKEPDEESRRFIRECEDAGVPREALMKMDSIKANRLSGYPSPAERKRNLRELSGLVPMMPEQGKSNYLDEAITVYCGPDKVETFNPKEQKPDWDAAFAVMENSAMMNGEQPLIVSGMNNVTHLQIHLQDAAEKMEPLRETMESGEVIDPAELEKAFRYVTVLGAHCEEHLAALENDPSRRALYNLFKTQLTNLVSFHGKLRGAIRDAARQAQQAAMEQEQATALGMKTQAELAKTQADIQRADMEAAADIRRKNIKAEHGMQLSNYKAQGQTRIKAATAIADTKIKKASNGANGNK